MSNKAKAIIGSAVLAVGAALVCVGAFVVNGDNNQVATALCAGIGALWVGFGLPLLLDGVMPIIDPTAARTQMIDRLDERNIAIRNASKAKAFDHAGIVMGALVVAALILGTDVFGKRVAVVGICYLIMRSTQIVYWVLYSKTK